MIKIKLLVVFMVVLQTGVAYAQKLKPFVFNSGGGTASASNINLVYSIGESVVGDFSGFISAIAFSDITTDIDEEVEITINLYPNPVRSTLNASGIDNISTLNVYSMQGILLLVGKGNTISLDSLSPASYLVLVKDKHGNTLTSKIIVKI